MKVGLHLPVMVPGLDRRRILEWSRRIDAGPFSTLAVGERMNFANPEAMVTLSAAAAVTERVSLAFGVLVLPLHQPVLLAKQLATLDVLSNGRLSVGVGVGGRKEDYDAVGARYDRKLLSRMEEFVAIMRRAWSGEIMGADILGPVGPKPLQPNGPEIMLGALFPQSIRRGARYADGISAFSFGPTFDDVAEKFALARAAWTEAKRERPPRLVTGFWFALGKNGQAQMGEYLDRYLRFMGDEAGRNLLPHCRAVTPAGVRESLRICEEAGAEEVVLSPTSLDPDEVARLADIVG
jgi:alkanesulfonate monooxygenase SsuD/methylene tetrahydromethanopterin reductase-like flavin-dependent oxidoreductase (luciferase family)